MARTIENKIQQAWFFCFPERTNRFHVGDTKISVIKVGGIPCDGKPNIKWPPVGPGARLHGNFCGGYIFFKSTSKFGKMGLLDDPGSQESSLKEFKCGLGLSNG
jgi:hypothetical protein